MKKLFIAFTILTGAAFSLCSCNKDYKLTEPQDFTLSAPQVAMVGEPVNFTLGGSPDLIMFYSGEFGHEFEKRDVDILYPAKMSISFLTVTSSVETVGMNPQKMFLKYSSDFSGEYTKEAVAAATWTDITDRFAWPTEQGQSIESGDVAIDDIFGDDGRPIYLMLDFPVLAYNASTQPSGRVQWNVQKFVINGGTDFGISEMYNHMTLGWNIVDIKNYDQCTSAPQMPTATNLRLNFRTQFKPTVDIEYAAISCPIYSAEGVNVGRNKGISVKKSSDPHLTSYSYTYNEPGEYDVTFTGINANFNGNYEIPRTVKLKVVQNTGDIVSPTQGDWK